jgi:hypothetical protein
MSTGRLGPGDPDRGAGGSNSWLQRSRPGLGLLDRISSGSRDSLRHRESLEKTLRGSAGRPSSLPRVAASGLYDASSSPAGTIHHRSPSGSQDRQVVDGGAKERPAEIPPSAMRKKNEEMRRWYQLKIAFYSFLVRNPPLFSSLPFLAAYLSDPRLFFFSFFLFPLFIPDGDDEGRPRKRHPHHRDSRGVPPGILPLHRVRFRTPIRRAQHREDFFFFGAKERLGN